MAKIKTIFTCQECGYESPRWLGKCPSCNQWNTFVEELKDNNTIIKEKISKSILPENIDFVFGHHMAGREK